MIYFSELKDKKVVTEDGIVIGKIADVIFRFTDNPAISKILIKSYLENSKEDFFISLEDVNKINSTIHVNKNYKTVELSENELFIDKNLLDKQIIDIKGFKVVRVNDVVIQDKNNKEYFILGVDTSFYGILRWFNLEKITSSVVNAFNIKEDSQILPWANIQPLELTQGKVVLNVQQEKLANMHPADLADYLETTNIKNVSQIIDLLDKEFAAQVIAELNMNYQISLLKKLPIEKTAKLITFMDTDDAVDVLSEFTEKKQEAILSILDKPVREEIEKLLAYEDTLIGQYLNTDFFTVSVKDTASKIIEKIKNETADMSFLKYIYVLNENRQLVGVINLHELLLQRHDTPIFRFMRQNIVAAYLNHPLKSVFKKLIKYKLSAIPVINEQKNILGIVTIDDIGEDIINQLEERS